MEVPRRRRDVGGEAPRQGRGVLQEGIDRCQNQAAGRWSEVAKVRAVNITDVFRSDLRN